MPRSRRDSVEAHRPPAPLACTVRGCGLPLDARDRTRVCARGHAYDVARSGYVNLLQPQDRRSAHAGDAREAVAARARLLAADIGRHTHEAVVARVAALDLPGRLVVADLGCGSGDALDALARRRPITGVGVDLSTAAVEHAARRFSHLTWVVANADRRLPLLDSSVDVVLSLHGRRNAAECARVLAPGRFLIAAVPAADDLIELRTLLQGTAVHRERTAALMAEHERLFRPVGQWTVREHASLERPQLLDLLRGTYRGARAASARHAEQLAHLEVTLSSDLCLFQRQ